MSVSRIKTWAAEVLTFADLNAEFNNILNNGTDVGWPLTKNVSAAGYTIGLDSDGNSSIDATTNDIVQIKAGAITAQRWRTVASGVNYIDTFPAVTTANPYFIAAGSDSNVGLGYKVKGTASPAKHTWYDGNGNEILIGDVATASAVNEITITNAATGSGATISATGGDTNIDLPLTPKGTGAVSIAGATGNPRLKFTNAGDIGTTGGGSTNPTNVYLKTAGTLETSNITSPPVGGGATSPLVISASTGTTYGNGQITVKPGGGVGGSTGSPLIVQGIWTGSAVTYNDRFVIQSCQVTLVKSSATTLFTVTVPTTLKVCGGSLFITHYADNGTDVQCLTSLVNFSIVNKAGTLTTAITNLTTTDAKALSTGTFTATYAATATGTSVAVTVNGVPSITPTHYYAHYQLMLNCPDSASTTSYVVG